MSHFTLRLRRGGWVRGSVPRIGSVLHVVTLAGIASFNFPVLDHFNMASADSSPITPAIADVRAATRR